MLESSQQCAVAEGLRGGSREAGAALYAHYSDDVWRYAARLLGADAAAVADVVQETFLAAARSAGGFDAARGSLWSWLAGIAHRQVALYWRDAARAARVKKLAEQGALEVRQWLESAEANGAASNDTAAKNVSTDAADVVRSVLAELPAEYAALLTAKYLDERTLLQLAEQFGGSVEAMKSKLARARGEFRGKFKFLSRQPAAS